MSTIREDARNKSGSLRSRILFGKNNETPSPDSDRSCGGFGLEACVRHRQVARVERLFQHNGRILSSLLEQNCFLPAVELWTEGSNSRQRSSNLLQKRTGCLFLSPSLFLSPRQDVVDVVSLISPKTANWYRQWFTIASWQARLIFQTQPSMRDIRRLNHGGLPLLCTSHVITVLAKTRAVH